MGLKKRPPFLVGVFLWVLPPILGFSLLKNFPSSSQLKFWLPTVAVLDIDWKNFKPFIPPPPKDPEDPVDPDEELVDLGVAAVTEEPWGVDLRG